MGNTIRGRWVRFLRANPKLAVSNVSRARTLTTANMENANAIRVGSRIEEKEKSHEEIKQTEKELRRWGEKIKDGREEIDRLIGRCADGGPFVDAWRRQLDEMYKAQGQLYMYDEYLHRELAWLRALTVEPSMSHHHTDAIPSAISCLTCSPAHD